MPSPIPEPLRITLYLLDWDPTSRGQRVEMLDTQTQEVLASHDVTDFHDGIYLTFNAPGDVTFRITDTANYNAVISGIFIDPAVQTTQYAFDLASNRVRKSTANGEGFTTVTYAYDANDRLTQEVKDIAGTETGDTNTAYAYGPSDSQTTQTGKTVREGTAPGSGTITEQHTFTYDVMGRMVSTTIDKTGSGGTVTTTTYQYNANGLRVSETTGSETRTYLFDLNNPTGFAQAIEEHLNGTLDKTYTLGHDVIAQHDSTNGLLRLLYDGHGSTRAAAAHSHRTS